jgi:hypothetical protein
MKLLEIIIIKKIYCIYNIKTEKNLKKIQSLVLFLILNGVWIRTYFITSSISLDALSDKANFFMVFTDSKN